MQPLWLKQMPAKNPFDLWQETMSSSSRFRDTFRGMHLSVLPQASQQKLDNGLLYIWFEIGDFVLCEFKGRPSDMVNIELPAIEGDMLWLCLQFHGKLTFSGGRAGQPETCYAMSFDKDGTSITVAVDKIWVLFLGISGVARQQLLAEYPVLRQHDEKRIFPICSITYMDRRTLEMFAKQSFGPFTTLYHIGQLLAKLYSSYIRKLATHGEQAKGEPAMLLYHRAIAYVREHYLDADLNRMTISEALHCSTRNLSRAFEGRASTLNSTILLTRLYKGRELLRSQPDLTVDEIALRLHFPNAKYFATRYKMCFHCTPREEKANIGDWESLMTKKKRPKSWER